MKHLLLLRHAKAVAKDPERDFDRVLAERGRSDMKLIAGALVRGGIRPDLALVSPSARTRETWDLAGFSDVPARFDQRIYEGDAATLAALIREVEDDASAVMLVGHNPGISELAWDLLGQASGRRELTGGMPTAALAVIELPATTWRVLPSERCLLARYVTPAALGGGPRS